MFPPMLIWFGDSQVTIEGTHHYYLFSSCRGRFVAHDLVYGAKGREGGRGVRLSKREVRAAVPKMKKGKPAYTPP